ncbi:MFS transporter [Jatrophihabitans sp. DSM 45814]
MTAEASQHPAGIEGEPLQAEEEFAALAPAPPTITSPAHRLGVFAHRDFRLIVVGNTVSQLGFWAQYVAVGWVATSVTDSKFLITLAFSAQFWPTLIFSPLAGLLADRQDRRRLVMYGNLAMVVPPFVIGLLIETGHITYLALLLLVFVGGIGQAFTQPATVAFIPALVPADRVPAAIAVNSGLTQSTRIVGPALAGAVIGAWGVAWGFNINAISFLGVTLACMLVRARSVPRAHVAGNNLAELKAGIAYARRNRAVGRLILLTCVVSLLLMQGALMPIFAKEVLHGDVSTYGLLSSAPGIGAVFGALAFRWIQTGRPQRAALVVGGFGIGLALVVVGLSRSVPLTVAALGLFGGCYFAVSTTSMTVLITVSEDAFRGRVISLFMMATAGLTPVSSIIAGGLASILGAPLTVGLCGAAVLVTLMAFCLTHGPSVIRQGTESHAAEIIATA